MEPAALLETPIGEPAEGSVQWEDKQVPTDERPEPEVQSLPFAYRLGDVDTSALRKRLEACGEAVWHPDAQEGNNRLRRAFHDGLGVGSIIFRTCDDMMTTVLETPWWREWQAELRPVFQQLGIPEDAVIRCLLAGMPPGLHIPIHHDTGWWSMNSRRIHVPVHTDPERVVFRAGRDVSHMKRWRFAPDVALELNNRAKHEVYNGWSQRRVHLIFDCLYGDARVPIRRLRPEEVVVQARRSAVVLPSREHLHELMDRVLASRKEEEEEGRGEAASVVSAATTRTAGTVSQEDRDRDDDTRLMLAMLAKHDPLRQEARDALLRLGHRREDGLAKAEATRAVLERAEQMGGPAAKQRLLFVCRRFEQGELPDEQMLGELECLFAHTLQRTMEQDGLVLLVPDAERREALMRAYLARKRERAASLERVLEQTRAAAATPEYSPLPSPPTPETARLSLGARQFPPCQRSLPAFLIVGVQKCGTTALYDYLCQHPRVCRGRQKEPHFFDWKWDDVQRMKLTSAQAKLAYTWFKGSQPADGLRRKYALVFNTPALAQDRSLVTGEGTPSYLLGGTPLARRVQSVAPNAHLIVCLRDPVKRAYSHYQMVVDPEGTPAQKRRRGEVGGCSFEDVVLEDLDVRQAAPSSSSALTHTPIHMQELMGAGVTPGEESDDAFDSQYLGLRPNGHGSHSFVGRGLYAKQLRLWLRVFPAAQISVVLLDQLKTAEGVNDVCNQLWGTMGLPPHSVEDTEAKNARKYEPVSEAVAAKLRAFYKPHNEELYRLLGRDLGWDTPKG